MINVDGGAVAFKIGIETTAKEFLDVVKVDEDGQVETLTDEELSDVFRAMSPSLLSTVRCVLNVPGQLHEKVLKQVWMRSGGLKESSSISKMI